MKKVIHQLLISLVFFFIISITTLQAQNIGINTDGSAPDNSAMLDIKSEHAGLLIPRVVLSSLTDGTTIPNPLHSLLVYNNSVAKGVDKGYYFNEGSPASPNWVPFLYKGNAWNVTGNEGTTAGTNFLGTTDVQDLIIKTNGTERLKFDMNGGTTDPTLKITSVTDQYSGLEINANSLTKGNALKLVSTSTAGLTGQNTKMLSIIQSGANANASHASTGIYTSVTNSGTTSFNYGMEFLVNSAFNQVGILGNLKGVSGATNQKLVGFSLKLDGNGNTDINSSNYGIKINSMGSCAFNYGMDIIVASGTSYTAGLNVANTSPGSNPSYGIKSQIIQPTTGNYGETAAGLFINLISTNQVGFNYAVRGDAIGPTTTGYNTAGFFTASDAPAGQNYAIIVPHENASSKWGGWVGIGCLYPKRLLQVDGIARFGGDHAIGRIEIQNGYAKQTTIQASNSVTDLKIILPGTKGAVNDVLMVTSIAGDSTTTAWGTSPTLNYWNLNGNTATTPGTNFIGTTDYRDLVIKTNGVQRMRFLPGGGAILNAGVIGIGTNAPVSLLHVNGTAQLGTKDSLQGDLKFFTYSSGFYTALMGNATANVTYTLPGADGTSGQFLRTNGSGIMSWGSSAPVDATYITQTANATLTNEQALSALSTGYMKVTTTTGVITSQATPIPVTDGGSGTNTAPTQGGVIYAASAAAMASTAAGTAGQILQSNGSSAPTWVTKKEFLGVQTFTNGTTSYTPTSGTTEIVVEMWGGGGAGGSVTNVAGAAGGGGGSGGYALYNWSAVGAGPYTIAIGAGGTAVAGGTGNAGGITTFNNGTITVTAYGGSGGTTAGGSNVIKFMAGGAGGAVSTNGTVNAAGAPGANGMTSTVVTTNFSGNGGSTSLGGGGLGVGGNINNTAIAGNAARADTGSGGSGARTGTTTAALGGAGADGLMIIYEYK